MSEGWLDKRYQMLHEMMKKATDDKERWNAEFAPTCLSDPA